MLIPAWEKGINSPGAVPSPCSPHVGPAVGQDAGPRSSHTAAWGREQEPRGRRKKGAEPGGCRGHGAVWDHAGSEARDSDKQPEALPASCPH